MKTGAQQIHSDGFQRQVRPTFSGSWADCRKTECRRLGRRKHVLRSLEPDFRNFVSGFSFRGHTFWNTRSTRTRRSTDRAGCNWSPPGRDRRSPRRHWPVKGCRTFVSGRRNNRQRIRPYDPGWRSHTGTTLPKLPMLRQPEKENIENENLVLFVKFIDEKIWLDIE